MTDEIKIGDRVRWRERPVEFTEAERAAVGTVHSFVTTDGVPVLAHVIWDGQFRPDEVPVRSLDVIR